MSTDIDHRPDSGDEIEADAWKDGATVRLYIGDLTIHLSPEQVGAVEAALSEASTTARKLRAEKRKRLEGYQREARR